MIVFFCWFVCLLICGFIIFAGTQIIKLEKKIEEDGTRVFVYVPDMTSLPTRGTKDSKGLDIYTQSEFEIQPGQTVIHDTGIVVDYQTANEIQNIALNIYPRSSLAAKRSVILGNSLGLIDPDYCGKNDTLKLILINLSKEVQKFEKHEKIAQLVFTRNFSPNYTFYSKEIIDFEENKKDRGGLGSTGK